MKSVFSHSHLHLQALESYQIDGYGLLPVCLIDDASVVTDNIDDAKLLLGCLEGICK